MASEAGPVRIEEVWRQLDDALTALSDEVLKSTTTVKWRAQMYDNPSFLMRAHAHFERVGCPEDADLVISVNVHRGEGLVSWDSDAAQFDGHVLAQGPRDKAPSGLPRSSWYADMLEDTIGWFHAETPNFIAYLNQESTPYDVD